MEVNFPRVGGAYGGKQAWFDNKTWAAGGCGVIAAANVYYYFRGEKEVDKDLYMDLAQALYYWLRPIHFFNPIYKEDTYGLISSRLWRDRSLRFFRIRGLELEAKTHRYIKAGAFSLIKRALNQGQLPVIMVLGLPGTTRYNNHFMVVTGYEGENLIVSSWGRRIVIPFAKLSQGGNFFKLVLFKKKQE